MAATPANSSPIRRAGESFFSTLGVASHGRRRCCGMDRHKLVVPSVVPVSKSGAGLPAGISSPFFAHLFVFGMLGLAVGALVIRHSEQLASAMAAAMTGPNRLQIRPIPPSCRSRSPPS